MKRMIPLPISTMDTVNGPLITKRSKLLIVKYDWQADDAAITWAEIAFNEVLAFRYDDERTCWDAALSTPAREMVEYTDTPWLREALDIWDSLVGWHKFQQQRGGRSRFRHYVINFEDVGALQVICSRAEVKLCEPPRLDDALP